MKINQRQLIGFSLCAAALILNPLVLGMTLSKHGAITNPGTTFLIICFESACAAVGMCVLLYKKYQRIANILLLLAVVAVTFPAVELILRICYTPLPVMAGWRSFVPDNEKNQLGFRGRPIAYGDSDKVILLLGDSQVEGQGVPFDAMPEKQLSRHLDSLGNRAKVFTIGAGGYGQDQELLALQEYFRRYRADVVVLWETPKNDFWNNLFPTHWPAEGMPKPTYILKNGSLQGPDHQAGEMLYGAPLRMISLVKQVLGRNGRDRQWERILPAAYLPLADYDGAASTAWQERWDKNIGGMRDENLATEKSHLAAWLAPASPRMMQARELTRKLVLAIDTLAWAHYSRLIIIQVNPGVNATDPVDTVYRLNGRLYRTSAAQMKEHWAIVNKDLFPVIIPVVRPDWRVSGDDAHLNAAAIDDVMAVLANYVTVPPLTVNP